MVKKNEGKGATGLGGWHARGGLGSSVPLPLGPIHLFIWPFRSFDNKLSLHTTVLSSFCESF